VTAGVRRREIADELFELLARNRRSLLPHDAFGERETQRLRTHLLECGERWGTRRRHVVARRAVLFVDGFAWGIDAGCLSSRQNDRGRKRKHGRRTPCSQYV